MGRHDDLAIVRRPDDSGWRYLMEVAAYVTPPAAPDPAALLGGLRRFDPDNVLTPGQRIFR